MCASVGSNEMKVLLRDLNEPVNSSSVCLMVNPNHTNRVVASASTCSFTFLTRITRGVNSTVGAAAAGGGDGDGDTPAMDGGELVAAVTTGADGMIVAAIESDSTVKRHQHRMLTRK